MKIKRRQFLTLTGAAVAAAALAGCGGSSASSTAAASSSPAASGGLAAPTDFTVDPETGEFSFTGNDDRMGYYNVRVYKVENGVESNSYSASSSRINGDKTGTITGSFDTSEIGWGTYHIKLVSFAAAGTDMTAPDAVVITAHYGVGLTFEQPEMLVFSSGNTMAAVIDWWSLCDYYFLETMPDIKFSVYSDADCTTEVFSDTVSLDKMYEENHGMNPPNLIHYWGWSKTDGMFYIELTGDSWGSSGGATKIYFNGDYYPYTLADMGLEAGTYYVTIQALSTLDYAEDSKVSSAVEITLTDAEPSGENFATGRTENWTDPQMMDMPGANPGQQDNRVDNCTSNPKSAEIVDE